MARSTLSRDSLEYERRGRIVGDDQHRNAIRRRSAELLRLNLNRQAPTVARVVAASRGSREAMVKVINWSKSSRSALSQARYASRSRESDEGPSLAMTNERGEALVGPEIDSEIASWELRADRDNLSKTAKAASREERAAMAIEDRLARRQSAHIIFSVPAHAKADAKRLEAAVSAALAETLGAGGFRYVYAIHTDHSSRPHAHVIIKATSEPYRAANGRQKTRQLRIGPREIDTIRQIFAGHAREHGIDVTATRRVDRPELREEIIAGKAPLRENVKQGKLRSRSKPARDRRAEQRKPPAIARLTMAPTVAAHDQAAPQVGAAGVTPGDPATAPTQAVDLTAAADRALAAASTGRAIFTDRMLIRATSAAAPSSDQAVPTLRDALAREDLVTIATTPRGHRVFATRQAIDAEADLLERARGMAAGAQHQLGVDDVRAAVTEFDGRLYAKKGFTLTEEQRQAVEHVTAGADLASVVGTAGAGKSTMLEAAKEVWERNGYSVYGGALSGIAAANLSEAGLESRTLAAWQHAFAQQDQLKALVATGEVTPEIREAIGKSLDSWRISATDKGDYKALARIASITEDLGGLPEGREASDGTRQWVSSWAERRLAGTPGEGGKFALVIDEAGMVGTDQMNRVLSEVEKRGGKVVLVGDWEQLQPIEAGAAFRTIAGATGYHVIGEVQRQREEWAREATKGLAAGREDDFTIGMNAYADRGHIKTGLMREDGSQIDLPATWRAAEGKTGGPLTADDRRIIATIADYQLSRVMAGALWREIQAGAENEKLPQDFKHWQQQRNDAAATLSRDLENAKPWLSRYGVAGDGLAADILFAEGGITRENAQAAAPEHAKSLGLDLAPLDKVLSFDFRSGARDALLSDWSQHQAADPDKSRLILAYTRQDVAALNEVARQAMQRDGRLSPNEERITTPDGELAVAAGDRIMFLANDRSLGVQNGTLGSVVAIEPPAEGSAAPILRVKLDRGAEINIDTGHYNDIAHGYAATIHKTQGATVDETFVLASSNMDRHLSYVSMSRHRDNATMYAAATDALSPATLIRTLAKGRPAQAISDHLDLATSRQGIEPPADRLADLRETPTRQRMWASEEPETPLDRQTMEKRAARALGRALDDTERTRVATLHTYQKARSEAGALWAEMTADGKDGRPPKDHQSYSAFQTAQGRRNAAAAAIGEELDQYRPLLKSARINGQGLAADILVAQGTKRQVAELQAPRFTKEKGLQDAPPPPKADRPAPKPAIPVAAPARRGSSTPPIAPTAERRSAFERKAPEWYAEHGMGYERRRLAAAAASREPVPAPAPVPTPTPEKAPTEPRRGLLARMFGRRAEQQPAAGSGASSGPHKEAGADRRRGGYFSNFENYRQGAQQPAAPARTIDKVTAHFRVTHREPEAAAESFKTLYREAPKLALWAAHRQPLTFGDPTGERGPGFTRKDAQQVLPAGDSRPPARARGIDPFGQEALARGERQALRDAASDARAQAAARKAQPAIVRSLGRLAERIERETPTDPDSKQQAAHVRDVARNLAAPDQQTRSVAHDQAERIRDAAAGKDKDALYRELEEQVRQRDQARAKHRPRDRDDGGRDR